MSTFYVLQLLNLFAYFFTKLKYSRFVAGKLEIKSAESLRNGNDHETGISQTMENRFEGRDRLKFCQFFTRHSLAVERYVCMCVCVLNVCASI